MSLLFSLLMLPTETVQESSYLALSMDRNQFGRDDITSLGRFYKHSCNHSIITTLFQRYLLTLSQINSKNYLFHTFSALKLTKWNLHKSFPSV